MNAKLVFWTVALADLAIVVACGARGVRAIRRGEVRTHRRMMLMSTALVALFLVSYLAKVAWLGKEDRSAWTAFDHAVLGIHELPPYLAWPDWEQWDPLIEWLDSRRSQPKA